MTTSYSALLLEAIEDHACVEWVEGRDCLHIAALRQLAVESERLENNPRSLQTWLAFSDFMAAGFPGTRTTDTNA